MSIENYTFDEVSKLGKGCYGIVFKGIDMRSNKIVAIKILHNNETFDDEILSLYTLKNIFGYCDTCGICIDDSFQYNDKYFIITDFIDGETMTEYIKKNYIDENNEDVLIHLAKCLYKLHHEAKIVHGDIHTGNIMFYKQINQFRIIDYGLSMKFPNKDFNEENFNIMKADDIMSLGYLLIEYYNNKKIGNIKLNNLSNEKIRDTLKGFILENPKDRINFFDKFVENNNI